MSRISIGNPFLRHHIIEQVHHRIMVRHEPPLVLYLVEENVLTVDPDIRVSNLPVDCDLSLYLISRIVFCDPEIRLAELAVAPAPPHNFHKPMDGRGDNIWNILQLRTPRDMNILGCAVELYVPVNILDHMITLTDDHVVNAQSLRVPVPDLHLPGARPTQDQLSLRELLPRLVDLSDKLEKLLLRIGSELATIGEHHAHGSQPEWIHR